MNQLENTPENKHTKIMKIRAINVDGKTWMYLNPISNLNNDGDVIADTISYGSGVVDITGKKEVFSGDIIRHCIYGFYDTEKLNPPTFIEEKVVVFQNGAFSTDGSNVSIYPASGHTIEIVGNKFINPLHV